MEVGDHPIQRRKRFNRNSARQFVSLSAKCQAEQWMQGDTMPVDE
jgi:hypothetical protein